MLRAAKPATSGEHRIGDRYARDAHNGRNPRTAQAAAAILPQPERMMPADPRSRKPTVPRAMPRQGRGMPQNEKIPGRSRGKSPSEIDTTEQDLSKTTAPVRAQQRRNTGRVRAGIHRNTGRARAGVRRNTSDSPMHLLSGVDTPLIAAALDWSRPYTRAVLRTWKLRPAYCHAVLAPPVRFDLEGNPTDQPVDEDARTLANIRLATWASRRHQSAPHKPPGGGGGTTACSPTQAPDHRKPADGAPHRRTRCRQSG